MRGRLLILVAVAFCAVPHAATTPTFTPTGSIRVARAGHQATLLRDGGVLVTGGYDDAGNAVGPAEIFDAVGSGAVAVPLVDGRILVAGGNRCGEIVKAAALFNPSTNAWSTTGSMDNAESLSQRGRACGRARLRGWWHDVAGGLSGECGASVGPAAAVDLFDPVSARWSPAGKLEIPRALAAPTVLPDGRVLVAGGLAASGAVQSSAEFFDPTSGGWNLIGSLQTARAGHTATRLANGSVLIVGGGVGPRRTATAEIYMPQIGFATNTSIPFRGGLRSGTVGRASTPAGASPPTRRVTCSSRMDRAALAGLSNGTCSVSDEGAALDRRGCQRPCLRGRRQLADSSVVVGRWLLVVGRWPLVVGL